MSIDPRPAHPAAPAEAQPGPVRRVMIIIDQLRPGGAERVVVHLATQLKARDVGVEVVCVKRRGELAESLDYAGITVHSLDSRRGWDAMAAGRLAKLIRHFDPDVLNVHDRSSLPYVMLANRLGRLRPAVYSAHGLLYNEASRARLIHRIASHRLAAITAVSEEVACRHAAHLRWSGAVEVIPNGVPVVERSAHARRRVRQELGIGEDAFVFLAMGNIRPEKGFEDLLVATAALGRTPLPRPIAVLIAGELRSGPYTEKLLAAHKSLALGEQVRLLGYRSDTTDLYSAADAFVLSSRSEGLPMVVLEAMTAALPIIATAVGGVPAAVGDSALLVPPAQSDQLANAMGTLVHDAQLGPRLGEAARARALAQYGVGPMTEGYLAVFAAAIRSHRQERGLPAAPAQERR